MSLPSEPITRKEQYLAKAAGQAVEIPAEPITREEAYLDAIAKGSGGGGGTSDYSQLTNKPQINGTTLIGNKSASDLGLVAAETGKGLSANNYTDEDKAIVGGVTAALADKADKSSVKNEFIGTLAQWNALTEEQRKAYDTYQITDDYTEGSGGLPDYSTTEQKTGQKWIDGKDVYFKVLTGFSATLVANSVVDTGVDISFASKLLGVTALGNDDISVIPVAGYKINNTLQLYAYQSGNVINNAIIYYTKNA